MTGALKRWIAATPATFALLATLIGTACFIGIVWSMPSPPPYVSITLDTELVRFRVVRPELAIPISGGRTSADLSCSGGPSPPQGLTGLLVPATGTMVQYRWTPQGVAIEVGKGVMKLDDQRECAFDAPRLLAVPHVAEPLQANARPLPIGGPAEAGSETGAASARPTYSLMRSGEVRVFGRTTLPPNAGELYPIEAATYPVPGGSRLASGRDIADARKEMSGAAWYGEARPGAHGFIVSATTDTNRLLLYRPGLDDQTETFSFGLFTRIFNDPSLGLFTLACAAFFLLAGAITGLMSVRNKG